MKLLRLVIENCIFEVPVFEKDGYKWVALRPLCDALGISFSRQRKIVLDSENIRGGLKATPLISVCNIKIPSMGGDQITLCINIDHVGEWIFGINPNKVKPEIRERMYTFRRKLQHVLYAAVTGHNDINQIASLVEEIKKMNILVEHLIVENNRLSNRIEELESSNQQFERFVTAEKKAAASRLAHQRWAKKGPIVA